MGNHLEHKTRSQARLKGMIQRLTMRARIVGKSIKRRAERIIKARVTFIKLVILGRKSRK